MADFFLSDQSFIGKCHPVTRLILLVLACLPPLVVDEAVPLSFILGLYLVGAIVSGASQNLWRVKWLILVFIVITVVLWPIFHQSPGKSLFRLGPFSPTSDSVIYGLSMGMRLVAFLVAGIIFLSATRIEDITFGLQKLGMPYRMSFALSLAFRLTPLFMETADQIAVAQKVRGLDLKAGGLIKRAGRYVAILVPVLIAALRRADGLALALESKGFGGAASRTSIIEYQFSWRDPFWLITLAAFTALLVVYRFGMIRIKFFIF